MLASCVADNAYKARPESSKSSVTAQKFLNRINHKAYARGSFKVGKPYSKKGQIFKPTIDVNYSKEGLASWYGPGFHGKKTANGAIYNQNEFTAAHPTMPLPSVAEVTNLENNRTIKVVVNDRGPFHHKGKRIIDLSKKGARALGMLKKGIARVEVKYNYEETKELLAHMSKKQQKRAVVAYNDALTHQFALRTTKSSQKKS